MSKVRTVDSHTHTLTEEAMRLLAKESAKVVPVLKGIGTPKATLEIDGRVVQDPIPTGIWDLGLRLHDMDANGVDVQVLSPTVFTFFYDREPALALACAGIQNEEMAGIVKRQPDRFIGAACRCRRRSRPPPNCTGR
jgi:aminocarboxymuconate-semialdehyde decarboxylase